MQIEIGNRYKWDSRFIELARYIASWSKDPSTQTGAVIVAPNRSVVSVGFNGFARGVVDSKDRYDNREIKYKMVVHCEVNAIVSSSRSVVGCTLYTTGPNCCPCAAIVIQSGITRCVYPPWEPEKFARWGKDQELAEQMFTEAGVEVCHFIGEQPCQKESTTAKGADH